MGFSEHVAPRVTVHYQNILYKFSIKIDVLGYDDLGQTKYHITG